MGSKKKNLSAPRDHMGHANITTTAEYTRITTKEIREALEEECNLMDIWYIEELSIK